MKMKSTDKITQSVAATVSDVVEGKYKKKDEDVKYPHMMYDPKTGKGVEAKNEKDHEELSKKGYTHDKPEKVDEVEEPRAKGEKDFKAKHKIKKSGEKEDGTVVKEEDEEEKEDEVEEAFSAAQIKKAVAMAKKSGGQMTPISKKIEKIKKGLSDHEEVKAALKAANESFEVQEAHEEASKMNEAIDKKAAYKKVFDAALKKFGVKSPAELKGDKKKEFFDYVDKNYDAGENETD